MKKIMGVICWIRGRHYQLFDSSTRTQVSHIIRSRCAPCGHPVEEVIPIGVA